MRIIGLLSWYDERASWLAGCIASYAEMGITHLVAVDGAYAMFPQGRARSGSEQADVIVETTAALGLHLTLVRPDRPWEGNEVEKRTAMFRHADAVAQPNIDWYYIIDADELCTRALNGWEMELAATELDAADIAYLEREDRDTEPKAQIDRITVIDPIANGVLRKLFRAIPGIRCVGNHYTWVTPDGRVLWDWTGRTPALDLTDHIHVEHRTNFRSLHRHQQASDYYRRRDQAGIEHR